MRTGHFCGSGGMVSLPVWSHVPSGGLPPEGGLPLDGICLQKGCLPPGGQTNTCENITFPQLRWREVIINWNKSNIFKDNLNNSFSNTSETHYKGDQHNDFNLSLQEGLWPENVFST